MNLREQLVELKETRDYTKTNIDTVVQDMLANIGDFDPVFRDELIYTVLARMIMSGTLSNKQIKEVTNKLLDEKHLFYGINELSTKVYTRTFSVLMLAPIIYKHRKDKLFTTEELIEVFNKVVDYFVRENDLHGYSDEYGWAHSVAHTADVFDELALCDELDKTHLDILLNVIKNKVAQSDYLYRHGEDDRLVTAINSLLSRGLHTNIEMIEWIHSFKEKANEKTFIKNFAIKTNTKNLVRSLYFTLIKQEKFQEVCKAIVND